MGQNLTLNSTVQLLPILDSNYVFLIRSGNGQALVVDPGEATAVIREIENQNLTLKGILITHHHADHIDGVAELRKKYHVKAFAPEINRSQIEADVYINDSETLDLAGFHIKTIALPGHTLGIHAYWFENEKWLFSGDVLFGLGCGRIFEGTYEQAYNSLQKIKSLPGNTRIFCTHEYTLTNLQFCKSISLNYPELADYEKNLSLPSVPLTLGREKAANPFLRAETLAAFSALRDQRNVFKT